MSPPGSHGSSTAAHPVAQLGADRRRPGRRRSRRPAVAIAHPAPLGPDPRHLGADRGGGAGLSPAYGVKRATIVEGWEPGRRRPASPATRTLLVTRKGEGGETEDWRRAIARELSPRIALAERFLVASPVWRALRVRVRAVAMPGRVPAASPRTSRPSSPTGCCRPAARARPGRWARTSPRWRSAAGSAGWRAWRR